MPRLTTVGVGRPAVPRLEQPPPFWWLRWVPTALLAGVVVYLLYIVGSVAIVPVLASLALAYVLSPLVERIQQSGFSRVLSVLIALAAVTFGLFVFLWFVIPDLWDQFVKAGSVIFSHFNEKSAREVREKLREISPYLDRLIGYRVYEFLRNPNDLMQASRDWTAGHLTQFLSTASGALDLMLIPFFVYYILVDFNSWRTSSEELIPPRFRVALSRLFDEVGRILQSYVLGQLVIAMIMGFLYAIGFFLLSVPAWAGLAALSGFLNVIPYVGTLSGFIMASLFTFANSGEFWRIAGIGGVFLAVQMIEGYILTPRILGDRLSLHPMAVFLGLLIGGKLFGFLGVLLAVPVIAVALVFLRFLRELYKASNFYHAGEVPPEEAARDTPQLVAQAANTVLAQQVQEQTGEELLAPKQSQDDPIAQEKTP